MALKNKKKLINQLKKIKQVEEIENFNKNLGDIDFEQEEMDKLFLLSGNPILLKYLHTHKDSGLFKYFRDPSSFSFLFFEESQEDKDKKINNPEFFLINTYNNYYIKENDLLNYNPEFIKNMFEIGEDKLNKSKFVYSITHYYNKIKINDSVKKEIIDIFNTYLNNTEILKMIKDYSKKYNKNYLFDSNLLSRIKEDICDIKKQSHYHNYIDFILQSSYEDGLIDYLFNHNKIENIIIKINHSHFQNIYNDIFNLNHSNIKDAELPKIKIIIEQLYNNPNIEENLKKNYNKVFSSKSFLEILKNTLPAKNDCSNIISYFKSQHKELLNRSSHHDNIVNFYNVTYNNQNNLNNYIKEFNINIDDFNHLALKNFISAMMKQKNIICFNNFIDTFLTKNNKEIIHDYISINFHNQIYKLNNKLNITKKDKVFFKNIILFLNENNISININEFLSDKEKHNNFKIEIENLILRKSLIQTQRKEIIKRL